MNRFAVLFTLVLLSLGAGVQSSLANSLDAFTPKVACDQQISHKYFKICYSNQHRIAHYTVHWLSSQTMNGRQSRTNDYRADKSIAQPVGARDYAKSGFDRGHLVPAADMKVNRLAMSESFYMSNMTPQRPGFNRGIWQSVERKFRSLVAQKGEAYVVTAPVLKDNLPTLKKGISIPESYYKIAYFPKSNEMIGYLIPNESQSGRKLSEFLHTVDEIEDLTNIDFFSQLPDHIEDNLESKL